jgi:hypothetical protein
MLLRDQLRRNTPAPVRGGDGHPGDPLAGQHTATGQREVEGERTGHPDDRAVLRFAGQQEPVGFEDRAEVVEVGAGVVQSERPAVGERQRGQITGDGAASLKLHRARVFSTTRTPSTGFPGQLDGTVRSHSGPATPR